MTLKPNPGPEDIGNELFQGFIPDLLKEIFSELNLDYVIELVRDGQYGTRDPKSDRWSGMIGQLVRGVGEIISTTYMNGNFHIKFKKYKTTKIIA